MRSGSKEARVQLREAPYMALSSYFRGNRGRYDAISEARADAAEPDGVDTCDCPKWSVSATRGMSGWHVPPKFPASTRCARRGRYKGSKACATSLRTGRVVQM